MTTPRWLAIVAVVAVAGIAVGRHTARTPDVTQQERATETIAVAETQEAAREETTHHEAQEAVERIVYRDRVVYRDGPVAEVTREVEGSRSQVATVADTHAVEVRVEVREVEVERLVERRVEVRTPLPDWRVGGLVGWDGGVAYGAQVERRLWGPVYVGAWGLSSGAVGGGLGLEFP